jgi:TRAP-type C4-dicarboxylate transport system substrate-binding protein
MKVRNASIAVLAALSCIAAVAGASAQSVTMKIAHPTIRAGLDNWAETFKDRIDKRAPGRLKIEIYPASQLGSTQRVVEGTQLGTVEMVQTPPEFLAGVDPRFGLLAAPGLFKDLRHGFRTVHDPEFVKAFWSLGDAKGFKIIGMTCEGPSDYALVRPMERLDDLRGRKIRTFGSRLERETLSRHGASGVPMPLEEVIPALQQRTMEGAKAAITVFVAMKFHTVAKYVFKANESYICATRFVSNVWFGKLPADLRQVILEEAAATDPINQEWSIAFIERLYKVWVQEGGAVFELTPAEQAELDRRIATVGDDVAKEQPEMKKMYDIIKAAAARQRNG